VNIHQNARLTVHGREAMAREVVSGATTVQEAAEEFRTCAATVRKWLRRYQLEGVEGMMDRSSRPRSCPWQITVSTTAEVEVLRRKRMTGDRGAASHLPRHGLSGAAAPAPESDGGYRSARSGGAV
jgi:transposase-like protein